MWIEIVWDYVRLISPFNKRKKEAYTITAIFKTIAWHRTLIAIILVGDFPILVVHHLGSPSPFVGDFIIVSRSHNSIFLPNYSTICFSSCLSPWNLIKFWIQNRTIDNFPTRIFIHCPTFCNLEWHLIWKMNG